MALNGVVPGIDHDRAGNLPSLFSRRGIPTPVNEYLPNDEKRNDSRNRERGRWPPEDGVSNRPYDKKCEYRADEPEQMS